MAAKLYRVAENSYVVADDIYIQQGDGDWVVSEILEEEELLARGAASRRRAIARASRMIQRGLMGVKEQD